MDDDKIENDVTNKNDGILLLRHKQEEIIAPYFIDLALELSQFTTWCAQECTIVNTITHTCKSIAGLHQKRTDIVNPMSAAAVAVAAATAANTNSSALSPEEILIQQAALNNRRKTRPQPWQYGEDYLSRENDLVRSAE